MSAKAQTGSWQPCDALGDVHDCYGWFDPYYSISGSCTVGGDPAYALPAPGEFSGFTAPFDELELSETAPDLPDVASMSVSATQDAVGYFAWVDGSGNPAPNPPSQALFQIWMNPGAYIFGWEPDSEACGDIADDYPGDYFVYDDSDPFDCSVSSATFNHNYVANVTNGIAKIDEKSYFYCSLTPDQLLDPTASAYLYDALYATPVPPPTLAISSGLGTTYHKDATTGGRDANVSVNGTINDDTVIVPPTLVDTETGVETVPYTEISNATYGGSWSAGSSCLLNESAGGTSSSGTFQPDAIYDFGWTCPSSAGTDDISLTATDSEDGITQTANDNVTFHEPFENVITTKTIDHPVGQPSPSNPEWTYAFTIDDGGTGQLTEALSSSDSVTTTYSVTAGGSSTEAAEESATVASNFSISVGTSVTVAASATETFTAQGGEDLACYYARSYTEQQGTADQYGADGYDGDPSWDAITNISSTLSFGTANMRDGE